MNIAGVWQSRRCGEREGGGVARRVKGERKKNNPTTSPHAISFFHEWGECYKNKT